MLALWIVVHRSSEVRLQRESADPANEPEQTAVTLEVARRFTPVALVPISRRRVLGSQASVRPAITLITASDPSCHGA